MLFLVKTSCLWPMEPFFYFLPEIFFLLFLNYVYEQIWFKLVSGPLQEQKILRPSTLKVDDLWGPQLWWVHSFYFAKSTPWSCETLQDILMNGTKKKSISLASSCPIYDLFCLSFYLVIKEKQKKILPFFLFLSVCQLLNSYRPFLAHYISFHWLNHFFFLCIRWDSISHMWIMVKGSKE